MTRRFLILTFAISYLAGIPFNFFVSSLPLTDFWRMHLPRLVTVMGPALAAIVVSRGAVLRTLRIPVRQLPWMPVIIAIGVLISVSAYALAGVAAVPAASCCSRNRRPTTRRSRLHSRGRQRSISLSRSRYWFRVPAI